MTTAKTGKTFLVSLLLYMTVLWIAILPKTELFKTNYSYNMYKFRFLQITKNTAFMLFEGMI